MYERNICLYNENINKEYIICKVNLIQKVINMSIRNVRLHKKNLM